MRWPSRHAALVSLLAILIVALGLGLTGAYASQVNISSQTAVQNLFTGPWNGATAVLTGGNGTYGPGAGVDRNMTYFFNVSPYVGNNLSNFRIWRFYSDTWGTSGAATAVCVYARSFSGSFSQAVAGTNATICVATSSLLGNATYFDWASPSFSVLGGNLTATYFFSPLAITGWNEAGTGTLDTWAILSFDTGNLTPSGFSPTVSSENFGYYPLDSGRSDVFGAANVLSFLVASRDSGAVAGETSYAFVQGPDGSSRQAKGFWTNMTFLAASFNSSKVSSPSTIRAIIQVQNEYVVSAHLENYKSTYVSYGMYDRFYAPAAAKVVNGVYPHPVYVMDAYLGTTGGAASNPVTCWASVDRGIIGQERSVKAVCSAPSGLADPSDRVILAWTNGTDIVTLTNSSRSDASGAVEYLSSDAQSFKWKIVSAARGNITEAFRWNTQVAGYVLLGRRELAGNLDLEADWLRLHSILQSAQSADRRPKVGRPVRLFHGGHQVVERLFIRTLAGLREGAGGPGGPGERRPLRHVRFELVGLRPRYRRFPAGPRGVQRP